MSEQLSSINESIHNSIRRLDEKAVSLFTAIGIIFGLSSVLIESFLQKTNEAQLIAVYIVGGTYLLSFTTLSVLFALLILPRRKKKRDLNRNLPCNTYSEDVFRKINDNDFESFLKIKSGDDVLIDQIKINASISHTKEALMNLMVFITIAFSILFVALIVLAVL